MSISDTPARKLPILKELELVAKQSWRLILACTAIGFVMAALSLQGANYSYPVEMQVTTVQQTGGGGGGSARGGLAQLSGLASLANLALPSTQGEIQFQLFIESLFSRDLADDIAKNHDMMVTLYRGQWDSATKSWFEPPTDTFNGIKLWIRGLLGLAPARPWHAPNGENLHSFISDNLRLSLDPRKTYIATLTFTTGNRDLSIRFLNLLVHTADERLRRRALERAHTYINYLSSKLGTVTVAEHRDALTQAIAEQERYAMVASSDKPFAAEVFQSPWASNLPASPSPRQAYAIYMILGALAGLGLAFIRHRYQVRLQHSAVVQRLPDFIRRTLTS